MLTPVAMVNNLVEKVDECPLNQGRQVLFAYSWDRENYPLYGIARCLPGCLSIEVNGRAVCDFRNCPLYRGCPLLRGVR